MTDNFALVSKTKGIFGRRISRKEYSEMCAQTSVSNVVEILKNTKFYGPAFAEVNELVVNRGQAESLFKKTVFEHLVSANCFSSKDDNGDFSIFFTRRYEIETLLNILRLIDIGKPEEIIFVLPLYLNDFFSFDLNEFSYARTFTDFFKILSESKAAIRYRKIFKPFKNETKINFDELSAKLIGGYYAELVDFIKNASKHEDEHAQKEIENLINFQIETTNLLTIYRLKYYFNSPSYEIKKRLIPFYGKFGKERFEQLIGAGGGLGYSVISGDNDDRGANPAAKRIISILNERYCRGMAFDSENPDISVRRAVYRQNKKALSFASNPAVAIYALSKLFEIEVDNLTAIIEGVWYGLPSGRIQKLIVSD